MALAAAIVAGLSYMAGWGLELSPAAQTVWKGSGVTLLAVYAALVARGLDGWLIAAVMTLGALGDVLLETHGLQVGAVSFLAGHLVAIWLYVRNRRGALGAGGWLAAAALVAATAGLAYVLPADPLMGQAAALYSIGLAAMAAAAWASRFPRAWTGLGALMFVVSDLLIFARAGALEGQPWVGYAVWSLYFAGQLLICLGVTRTLARR